MKTVVRLIITSLLAVFLIGFIAGYKTAKAETVEIRYELP